MGLTKQQEMRLKIRKSQELLKKQKRIKKEREKIKQNSDPRPKQGDIDRGVYKNYNEYRKAVQAWKKRNPEVNAKWFQKNKQKSDKPHAKDRVGKVDLNSKEYKEAKRINERTTTKKRLSKEERAKHIEIAKKEREKIKKNSETKTDLSKKYKQVTQDELDKKIKSNEKLKVKPKKMHWLEKRNRERFGDAHVDKLKKQYADFKAKRKKKKK